MHDRLDVLREAAAAVADAREQERRADARVGADGAADLVDVGADELAEVRDLVHERDARRQHRVGGVLGQLGAGAVHDHDRRAGARERRVELVHHLGAARVVGADDDAIGLHEVVDRRALLQELGIADDAERVRGLAADDLAHLLARADRHRALVDDDLVAVHRARRRRARRRARAAGRPSRPRLRRADGDEDDLGRADARRAGRS